MDLTELLDKYRVEYRRAGEHHHATEGWIQVDCLDCSTKGEGKFRLGLHPAGGANCWRCGPKHILTVLVELTGAPRSKCREALGKLKYEQVDDKNELRGTLVEPTGVKPMLKAHHNYLYREGFEVDELKTNWGLRGIGIAPSLQWRIYIPIVLDGKVVSWTTRSISNEVKAKYISAKPEQEILAHKSVLYGEDYAKHRVIVVEGPKDVWRIGPGAVATFGTTVTSAQLLRIAQYPIRYICFDNEMEAQRRANYIAHQLSFLPGETKIIKELDSKDPGSALRKEVKQLRRLLEK